MVRARARVAFGNTRFAHHLARVIALLPPPLPQPSMPAALEDGLQAWIEVDGVCLEEFQVDYNREKRTVCCWIASEAGKEFVIHWMCSNMEKTTRGHVLVDGYSLGGLFDQGDVSLAYFYSDDSHISALTFGPLMLTDDENAVAEESFLKALGTIEVRVEKGHTLQTVNLERDAHTSGWSHQLKTQNPIHETLKKAGCHRIVPGTTWAAEKQAHKSMVNSFVPSASAHPVTFIFNYRPKDTLRAMEILPAQDTAGLGALDQGSDSDVEEVTQGFPGREDDAKLKEHLRRLEEEMAEVKKRVEKCGSSRKRSPSLIQIKTENEPFGRFFTKGEVIDLTES